MGEERASKVDAQENPNPRDGMWAIWVDPEDERSREGHDSDQANRRRDPYLGDRPKIRQNLPKAPGPIRPDPSGIGLPDLVDGTA